MLTYKHSLDYDLVNNDTIIGHLTDEEDAKMIIEAIKLLKAITPENVSNDWWCPNCRSYVDATYFYLCASCGTYIEDCQPSQEWIEKAHEVLRRLE